MKLKLTAAALLLSSSTYALAADPAADEVVVVGSVYDWSGVYIGAQIGYGWGDAEVSYSPVDRWDIDPDGVVGGAFAGYNVQLSNGVVLGFETELNANGGSGTGPYLYYGEVYSDPDYWRGEIDLNWSGSTRARLGYAVDRWLPFVTGGLAYADYDFRTHYAGAVYSEGDGTLLGWTIGGGVEYAVTDNLRVRGSYLFTDYGSESFDTFYGGTDTFYDRYEIDLDTHTLSLGVSFNW